MHFILGRRRLSLALCGECWEMASLCRGVVHCWLGSRWAQLWVRTVAAADTCQSDGRLTSPRLSDHVAAWFYHFSYVIEILLILMWKPIQKEKKIGWQKKMPIGFLTLWSQQMTLNDLLSFELNWMQKNKLVNRYTLGSVRARHSEENQFFVNWFTAQL